MGLNLISQIKANVAKLFIARGIIGNWLIEKMLPSAFGNYYNRMPSPFEPIFQRRKKTIRSFEIKWYLRNQNEIGFMNGEDGLDGYEPRVSTHKLDKTYAVYLGMCLHVSCRNRLGSLYHSRIETKGLLYEFDVVVNCLGNSYNGDSKTSALHLFGYGQSSLLGTISSDCKEHIEIELFYCIHNIRGPLATSA